MPPFRHQSLLMLLTLALGSTALPALADPDCVDFKWDVSKERALYAEAPAELAAGKDAGSAPVIVPNRLYRLRLAAQERVAFAATPGKVPAVSAFAGLATLTIAAPGSYRIAIDLPFWIDVVSNGSLLQPTDYQGQRACTAPHKIVVFELTGSQPFILQFSGAPHDSILVTVTSAPPRKF
jgi:hypothetical protein